MAEPIEAASWRRFLLLFGTMFGAAALAAYLFILLVDPYGIFPYSLPIERSIVSADQPFMYPRIVRTGEFDSLIVGTSTSRLIDPQVLNRPFRARIAHLALNGSSAFEQKTMVEYFLHHVGRPKVIIFGLDHVWCARDADKRRHYHPGGWPDWIFDNNPWNDYLHLFNIPTLEIAGRVVGYNLGLTPERMRRDGFELFVPPEDQYNLAKARKHIWEDRPRTELPILLTPLLDERQRAALSFPALVWLEDILQRSGPAALKILAFMPVHVAKQPWPGTRGAAIEAECKRRIAEVARRTGAKLIDWRIASPITREDSNYWDGGHYRISIAHRIERDLPAAVLEGRESDDGSYRIVVR